MAKLKANANKLVECGEEIVSLCDKYNEQIETLFNKLENVTNRCWTGRSANTYVQIVKKDKRTYTKFGNDLKDYGKLVRSTGRNVNTMIGKWKDR